VREHQQVGPVALGERAARRGDRHVVGHRPVAREHAAAQEFGRALIDGELEVAVREAVGDAIAEGAHQAFDLADFDDALDLAPRHQAQRDGVDEAEQAVAADGDAEEVGVLGTAALHQVAARVDEAERLDVADERRERQAAAMHVGRQAAAHRQLVGAGLLLREGPRLLARAGVLLEVVEELRPLHARLELDQAALDVELEDLVQLADVEHHAVGGEGLAAHRVPAAGDADRLLLGLRQLEGGAHGVHRGGLDDLVDARPGKLRVHVVDGDALDLLRRLGQRDLPEGLAVGQQCGGYSGTQEIAALQDALPSVIPCIIPMHAG
jgi:hypothetical protein